MTKEENDLIFERLTQLRINRPIDFALCRIGDAWDKLNSEYAKSGISENFNLKRKRLKELIANFKFSFDQSLLDNYCKSNQYSLKNYESDMVIVNYIQKLLTNKRVNVPSCVIERFMHMCKQRGVKIKEKKLQLRGDGSPRSYIVTL